MHVEHVARVRLAARRTAKEQRHLAVRDGLLGQIVVDAQAVLARVAKVLAHRHAGVRREELERRGLGRGGEHDGRVRHGSVARELVEDARDGRRLLADRDVDALHAGVLLIDDRVDRDGGLAGLTVADDELALAAADGDHRVDGLDAGL